MPPVSTRSYTLHKLFIISTLVRDGGLLSSYSLTSVRATRQSHLASAALMAWLNTGKLACGESGSLTK
eukprot:455258-Pyramimonas_sp.AAC.1